MTLYHCKKCNKKAIKSNSLGSLHQLLLQCRECKISWQICITCDKRWCSKNTSKAVQHFATKHPNSISHLNTPSTNTMTKSGTISTLNTNTSNNPSFLSNAQDADLTQASMSEFSKVYFNQNRHGTYNGIQKLVGNAFLQTQNGMAEQEESILQMRITKFCRTLTHSQQTEFLQILNDSHKNPFKSTRLPGNINDINRFYSSSKHSIFQNLPTPSVHIKSGHAYISLTSLIDHFLANKLPMNFMTCDEDVSLIQGITSCKEASKMRQSVRDDTEDNLHPMILHINL